MDIKISYFYQIRNFSPNIIPLSTAKWQPFWYGSNDNIFQDKRGVINGYEADCFKPQVHGDNLCGHCDKNPDKCDFIKGYYKQLCELDFKYIMQRFQDFEDFLKSYWKIENPVICLMVYEAPDNPCSERGVIMRWFKENGYSIEEWRKNNEN